MALEPGYVRPLAGRIVIVVEIVDRDDGIAPLQQRLVSVLPMNPAAPVTSTVIGGVPSVLDHVGLEHLAVLGPPGGVEPVVVETIRGRVGHREGV